MPEEKRGKQRDAEMPATAVRHRLRGEVAHGYLGAPKPFIRRLELNKITRTHTSRAVFSQAFIRGIFMVR